MIQDTCISIDFITTAMAVKLGTTDKSKIYWMLLQQAMKAKFSILNMIQHLKNVVKCSSYRPNSPTSSDSNFSPTFIYCIAFFLNGNVIFSFFISTVIIVYSKNYCDSMAYDCVFSCLCHLSLCFVQILWLQTLQSLKR